MKKENSFIIPYGAERVIKMILAAVTVLCILAGVATNLSLADSISDFSEMDNLIIETNYNDDALAELTETKENLCNAETVLIVKYTGERQSVHYSTLSTVEVEQVVKGDPDLQNKNINIYENNCISANRGRLYLRNFTVNNFMQQGKSYLVFLNKFKDYDKDYKQIKHITADEFVMADYYDSLFCLSETDSQILSADSRNEVDFSAYQNSEYIVFSQKQKDTLYEFKQEVLNAFM